MDSPKPSVDLEKELTCSICADLLYQPLTLLDCLHTFCGACVKEWFGWQAAAAENAPTPPAPDSPVFTCPSCRAPVRDSRRNATVSTLLDMFLAANPAKARSDDEKTDMDRKYRPGDAVLPRLNIPDRTPEQLRLEDEERRLINEVRAVSLQEAVAESQQRAQRSYQSSRSRRRDRDELLSPERPARESRTRPSGATPVSRSREPSTDAHATGSGRSRDARERDRRRRHGVESDNRLQAEQTIMLRPDARLSAGDSDARSRHSRSGSRHRSAEPAEPSRRQVEHQSSIRSLIGASSPGSVDVDREIEEFARQIQEEGLLDGLDLDNIDLTNNDELSRKITEAYRRRQRERSRQQQRQRRGDVDGASRQSAVNDGASETSAAGLRPTSHRRDSSQPSSSSRRRHSHSSSRARSVSATNQADDRSRPPPSNGLFLDAHETRSRRRTASGSRSSTAPVLTTTSSATQQPPRAAARSQTDLSQSISGRSDEARPGLEGARSKSSTSMPAAPASSALDDQTGSGLSFSTRLQGTPPSLSPPSFENSSGRARRVGRPADIGVGLGPSPLASSSPPSLSPGLQHQRGLQKQTYSEPSISCSRCKKEHIEYYVHYNCAICEQGNYNLCLRCYREGKGCANWFGFGSEGRRKWESRKMLHPSTPEPHVLTASRYLRPEESRSEDPSERLQRGAFCSRCDAWANNCYWLCRTCNDGEWGFCTACVNQGFTCTDYLLPVIHHPQGTPRHHNDGPFTYSEAATSIHILTPPQSPTASLHVSTVSPTSPRIGGTNVPTSKPITVQARCEICKLEIPPAQDRYHCQKCKSALVPDSEVGDYDICEPCYEGLVRAGDISKENGPEGWRRCPKGGHKMVVVGYRESRPGRWFRITVRDLVGGRDLLTDPVEGSPHLERWSWTDESGRTLERLVTVDVRATAPTPEAADSPSDNGTATPEPPISFPPDGGMGQRARAKWAYYPEGTCKGDGMPPKGTLVFPRGAEIREIKDQNGEWFSGTYMGYNNVFPSSHLFPSETTVHHTDFA